MKAYFPTVIGHGFINKITPRLKGGKKIFFAKVAVLMGDSVLEYDLLVARVAEDIVGLSDQFGIDCNNVFKKQLYRLEIELRGENTGLLTSISAISE